MEQWSGIRLAGRRVVLEPLTAGHEDGLWEASRDPATWRWLVGAAAGDAGRVPGLPRRGAGRGRVGTRDPVRDPRRRPRRRLDPLPGARAGAPAARDRLDVAPSVGVAERRQRRGEAAPAGGRVRPPRLPARGAEDGRAERALAGGDGRAPGRIRGRLPQAHAGQGGENRDSAYASTTTGPRSDDWPSVRENLKRRLAMAPNSRPRTDRTGGIERAPSRGTAHPARHDTFPSREQGSPERPPGRARAQATDHARPPLWEPATGPEGGSSAREATLTPESKPLRKEGPCGGTMGSPTRLSSPRADRSCRAGRRRAG